MIFHSENNLRKEKEKRKEKRKKEKEKRKKKKEKKEKRKKKKKRKKEKERKRGHKRIEIKAPCNNGNLVHTFQAWPSSFKFDVDRVVNDFAKQFNLSQNV
jgi:hypothetical protein